MPPHAQGREIEIALPFTGRWLARNSPVRRVPSHGTDRYGLRYAIDFVAVDDRHRTAASRDWRTLFASEPPERYFGFGRPVLAPGDGPSSTSTTPSPITWEGARNWRWCPTCSARRRAPARGRTPSPETT